eukprot:TRINITY_DN9700_c0_g1_i1.p1 TRINITY_DN9700_c0_g1~~TRINITY_DN9700_c0_g1_i1.p1  ORF type:complete len:614 (-),score=154.80 TRINITY_DN9700_c0_g1_i1:1410-3230(-)
MDHLELEHILGYSGISASLQLIGGSPALVAMPVGAMVVLSDFEDAHKQELLHGHNGTVTVLGVSPSNQLLASGQKGVGRTNEAPVIVWNIAKRQEVLRLLGHVAGITAIQFSPDNKLLATADESGRICVWDAASGSIVVGTKVEPFAVAVQWIGIDTSRRMPAYTLASVGGPNARLHTIAFDARAMQYVITTESFQLPSAGMQRKFNCAAVTNGGQTLFAGSQASDALVFDVASRVYKGSVQLASNGTKSLCDIGRGVLAGSGDGSIQRVTDARGAWKPEADAKLEGRVESLHSNGDVVVAGTSAGMVYRLRVADLRGGVLSVHPVAPVVAVAFATRSDVFYAVSADGSFSSWDLSSYRPTKYAQQKVAGVCVAAAAGCVATGWQDGALRAYDESGAKLWEVPTAHRGAVRAVAVAATHVVSGGDDGHTRVWNRRNGSLIHQFAEHKKPVTGVVADSGSAELIHSCGADRIVVTCSLKTQRRIQFHDSGAQALTGLAQRSDGERELISIGQDGRVQVWDIDIPAATVMVPADNLRAECVAVSPSGSLVAIGTADGVLTVRDTDKLMVLAQGRAHSAAVQTVAFTPDEHQIVSAAVDGSVCVWNYYT